MTHLVLGWTPRGTDAPMVGRRFKDLSKIAGAFHEVSASDSCPSLVAAVNLSMMGEPCVLLRTSREPDMDEVKLRLQVGSSISGVQTVSIPGFEVSGEDLCALGACFRGVEWEGEPVLLLDFPTRDLDALSVWTKNAGDRVIPVVNEVLTLAPGRFRSERLPGSTLLQASWGRHGVALKGAHDGTGRVEPGWKEKALSLGGAVLDKAGGRTQALAGWWPERWRSGSVRGGVPELRGVRKAERARDAALEVILREIADEERLRGGADYEKRIVRRWTSVLEKEFREGRLYGRSSREAYKIHRVAPGEFEVLLRSAPRSPERLQVHLKRR